MNGTLRSVLIAAAGTAIVVAVACTGGLKAQEGNAYPCDFDDARLEEGSATGSCPPGWSCSVTGFCKPQAPDELPATQLDFSQAELVYPKTLTGGIRLATAYSSQSPQAFVATDDGGIFSATRDLVQAPKDTSASLPQSVKDVGVSGVFVAVIDQAGNLVLQNLVTGQQQVVSNTSEGSYVALRAASTLFPYFYLQRAAANATPTTGELEFFKPILNKSPAFRPFLPRGGDGGFLDVLDARSVNRVELEYLNQMFCDAGYVTPDPVIPVAVTSSGVYYRHCLSAADAGLDDWRELTTSADPLSLPIRAPNAVAAISPPMIFRTDPTRTLFAMVYPTGGTPYENLNGLTVLRLSRSPVSAPTLSRAWGDCRPCGDKDRVVELAPSTKNGADAVDVLCARITNNRTSLAVRRVVGSAGAGVDEPCEFEDVRPSIDLAQIYSEPGATRTQFAVSGAVNDGLVIGGKYGQIWMGANFDSLHPMYLDRVPDQISLLSGRPFALLKDYVAVPSDAGTFAAISPKELTGANKDSIFPRSAPSDPDGTLAGWVVLASSDLAKVLPSTSDAGTLQFSAMYGSELLDNAGNPAPEPFFVEGVEFDENAGALNKHFVVTAADSLYESSRELTTEPRQLPPLTPELTPQPGATIRSLTVDRSDVENGGTNNPRTGEGGPLTSGYLIAGRSLYQFRLDSQPRRWSLKEISIGSGEPVEVWMKTRTDKLGRIGFRDGRVLSLPSGFPLVKPLQPASRVIDFANLNGVPVVLAENGLYVAAPSAEGSVLTWSKQKLPAQIEVPEDGGSSMELASAKLFVATENGAEVLYLFTDHGFVYRVGSAR